MEDRFLTILDGVSDAVLLGIDGVEYANPAARRLFGERLEEAFRDLCETLGDAGEGMAAATAAGLRCSVSVCCRDGRRIFFVQREEREAQDLRRLALSVSAGLRASANNQRSAAAMIRSGMEELESDKLERDFAVYEHGAFSIMRDAENLSLLSRRADSLEWDLPATFDPENVIRELIDSLKIYLPGREIRLENALKEPALIRGSRCDFERILMNLISNAVKYTEEDSPLVIALTRAGEQIGIRVIDRGCGIPPERMGEIFHAWRLERDLRDPKAGIGLGLAAVRFLAERMDGTVLVESRPGEGTAVSLHFPIARGQVTHLRDDPAAYDAAFRLLTHMADVLPSEDYLSRFMD